MPRKGSRRKVVTPRDLPPPPSPEPPPSPPDPASPSRDLPATASLAASPDKEAMVAAAVVVKQTMAAFREAQKRLERRMRIRDAAEKLFDKDCVRIEKKMASKCDLKRFNACYDMAVARSDLYEQVINYHDDLGDYYEAKIAVLGAKIAAKSALIKRLYRHKRARARQSR